MSICVGAQVLYVNLKRNDYHMACMHLSEEFACHAEAMKKVVLDQVKHQVRTSILKNIKHLDDHLCTFEDYHAPPSSPLVQLSLIPNLEDYQEAINKLKRSLAP